MAPGRHLRLQLQLDSEPSQLGEPVYLGLSELLVGHVGEGVAVPQRQGRRRRLSHGVDVARITRRSRSFEAGLQLVDIDDDVVTSGVARAHRSHRLSTEGTAQLGDVVLQDPRSGRRRIVTPQVVDQAVPTERLPPMDEQVDQQRPLLGAGRLAPAAVARHFERTEQSRTNADARHDATVGVKSD